MTLLSFFSCKNEKNNTVIKNNSEQHSYDNELTCVVNKNNAGKQIYDLDEATCFIALKLNKKRSDLNNVRKALIAEENYMIKIGLISEEPSAENETGSSPVLNIEKMTEYAQKEENVKLSKNELLEIYDTEVEYLKFIGVVTE